MSQRERQLTDNSSIRTILILAVYSEDLRLDKEIQTIKDAVDNGGKGNFKVEVEFISDPSQVLYFLQKAKPYIVHFCGHGSTKGLVVKKDDEDIPIDSEILADVFKEFSEHISCLILNACYSGKAAEEISKCIDYVIGINQKVKDGASITFADCFYKTLCRLYRDREDCRGNNEDIFDTACRHGNLQIRVSGIQDTQFHLSGKKSKAIAESDKMKAMSLNYPI